MRAIKGKWWNGQVVLDEAAKWPEGCQLIVEPLDVPELTGMTEQEQGDDSESIARWLAAFDAIPPLVMTAEEEAALLDWRRKVKEFNVEAVRRQMQEGLP
jgi:hypothetical protein